jgi:hypothetical protein
MKIDDDLFDVQLHVALQLVTDEELPVVGRLLLGRCKDFENILRFWDEKMAFFTQITAIWSKDFCNISPAKICSFD